MNKKYQNIFVNRHGTTSNSFMKTLKVINEIKPKTNYLLTKDGMIETKDNVNNIQPSELRNINKVTINGLWNTNTSERRGESSNILGLNGSLYTNILSLSIPVSDTTVNNLKYYGAKLVKIGDVINIETDRTLPVTIMKIGEEYV
jgi:hypothetical protein